MRHNKAGLRNLHFYASLPTVSSMLMKWIIALTYRHYHLGNQGWDEVLAEAYQQLFDPEIVRFIFPHCNCQRHSAGPHAEDPNSDRRP